MNKNIKRKNIFLFFSVLYVISIISYLLTKSILFEFVYDVPIRGSVMFIVKDWANISILIAATILASIVITVFLEKHIHNKPVRAVIGTLLLLFGIYLVPGTFYLGELIYYILTIGVLVLAIYLLGPLPRRS